MGCETFGDTGGGDRRHILSGVVGRWGAKKYVFFHTGHAVNKRMYTERRYMLCCRNDKAFCDNIHIFQGSTGSLLLLLAASEDLGSGL